MLLKKLGENNIGLKGFIKKHHCFKFSASVIKSSFVKIGSVHVNSLHPQPAH